MCVDCRHPSLPSHLPPNHPPYGIGTYLTKYSLTLPVHHCHCNCILQTANCNCDHHDCRRGPGLPCICERSSRQPRALPIAPSPSTTTTIIIIIIIIPPRRRRPLPSSSLLLLIESINPSPSSTIDYRRRQPELAVEHTLFAAVVWYGTAQHCLSYLHRPPSTRESVGSVLCSPYVPFFP